MIEFAEVRNARLFSSASENACFTSRWQSSNVPETSSAVMFSPSVVNCFSCASLMRFDGYKITTRIPGTPRNPCATALPVSPEVATSTVSVPRFAAHEITHQPRHESRAKILERQRRPVKQLQNVQPRRQRNQLHRKIDRLADDLPQHFFGHFRRRERFHDAKADFGERQRAKFFQFFRRAPRNFHRHIQSAVGRKPAQHRSAQRRQWRFPRCASVSHAYNFCEFNVSIIPSLRPLR